MNTLNLNFINLVTALVNLMDVSNVRKLRYVLILCLGQAQVYLLSIIIAVWFCFRKYYLDVQRREDGFDLSGPCHPREDPIPLRAVRIFLI